MIKDKDYKIHFENLESIKDIKGVYLLRNLDTGKLKIGTTKDVTRRLQQIIKSFQFCGTIPKLEIECFIEYGYSLELERFLHKELEEYNYQNEWFNIYNINVVLNKLNIFEYQEKYTKEIIDNNIYDEDEMDARVSEAHMKAIRKWQKNNKEHSNYVKSKSSAKSFNNKKATKEDLLDLQQLIVNKLKEYEK